MSLVKLLVKIQLNVQNIYKEKIKEATYGSSFGGFLPCCPH